MSAGVLNRILALASKETAHIRRDPRTAVLALGMPVALLVVFGYGVSFDLDELRVAWVNQDRTSESRTVGWRAFSSRDLVRVEGRRTPDEAILAFRGDGVRAVVVAPPGFSRDLERDRGELQVLVDASDGSAGSQTLAKLEVSGEPRRGDDDRSHAIATEGQDGFVGGATS
ncbi:MAG: hypothetical protein AAFZ18_16850, partial [Myxococcota bacterium]